MRILALLAIAGCSFQGNAASVDDGTPAPKDASPHNGPIDARSIDARMIDARMIDARMIDASTPISFVQGNGANDDSLSFFAVEAAGDLNVIGVSWPSSSITITSVTDTDGNTYSPIGSPIVIGGTATLAMYYASDIHQGAAGNTVQVKFSNNTDPIVVIGEYAGLAHTSPLDATGSGTGTSMTVRTASATTTHPHELLVGIAASTKMVSAGAGFTVRVPAVLDIIEDREVTTTGTYDATATLSSSGIWLIGVAAFVAAE